MRLTGVWALPAIDSADMKPRHYFLWIILGFGFLGVAFIYATGKSAEAVSGLVNAEWNMDSGSSGLDGADVAHISLEGVILDSEKWLRRLDKVKESDVPAVVVQINSPGGAVAPSQEMYQALMVLRKEKRVYCSLGDMAASGGYYIAAGCGTIFTNAGTLTGSIGVIMNFMNLKDLYAWANVKPVTIKAGKFKDLGSTSKDMPEAERALLQNLLDEVHTQFKKHIQAGRTTLDEALIETYADGRIFTGETAVELGFADQVGTLRDLYAQIKKDLKVAEEEELEIHYLDRQNNRWESFIDSSQQLGFVHSTVRALLGSAQEKAGHWDARLLPQLEAGKPYLLPYHWFHGDAL